MAEENNTLRFIKDIIDGVNLVKMLKEDFGSGNGNPAPQADVKPAFPQWKKDFLEQPLIIPELKLDFSFPAGANETKPASSLLPAAKPSRFDWDIISELDKPPAVSKPDLPAKPILEPDATWRRKLIHPSIVLILGKRGSGKSALAYRLLELFRYGPKPYVVGAPANARSLLPDWIGMVPSLEDLPNKAIAIIDEAFLHYHARGSQAQESRAMSQVINLSRQKEQTIIFVTQEARQVDRNIASSANIIVFKDLGILQLQFERPELNKLANQAKEALNSGKGDKRRWSYVYAPDTDFQGLLENELPSFWKPGLSRIFASEVKTPVTRAPRKLTLQDKIQKAREMRERGASYSEIARVLGVTKGSVVNYLKDYPYR